MRPLIVLAALAVAASSLAPTAFARQQQEQPVDPYTVANANADARPFPDDKLFKAFHGKGGIGRIVDGLVDRSLTDPRIADIFKGQDMVRLRRLLREQICYLLAGPCDYTGPDMKAAHKDMGLQNADFNALVENLQAAMDQEHVGFRAQNRLLAKLAPMHRDIVTR
jgi:hemoglobin